MGTAGKILQDWVTERQDAYTELQAFKEKASKCSEELTSTDALSPGCQEVRPPPSWFCNRRAASERMWELDEQLKKTHKAISEALKQAEEHESPPKPVSASEQAVKEAEMRLKKKQETAA